MKHFLQTHPFAKIGVFAFLLVPFVLLINAYSPPPELLPEAYSSTVLALEFAGSKEDATDILSPLSFQQIKDLDTINYIDFGFMLFYSMVLLLFTQKLRSIRDKVWLKYVLFLPVGIFFFDLLENIQLLKMTDLFIGNADDRIWTKPIQMLQVFTWLKWGGLSLCFLIFAIVLIKPKPLLILNSLILSVPFILLVGVLVIGSVEIKDYFASSVFFVFFVLVIFCFFYKKSPTESTSII